MKNPAEFPREDGAAMPEDPAADARKRERVVTTAVTRAARLLDLSDAELAAVLGVSETTVSRMRASERRLKEGSKQFELGVLFVRLFRSLDTITGGDDRTARSWLRNENLALGGRPLDQIKTISGLTYGIAYLDSRRGVL